VPPPSSRSALLIIDLLVGMFSGERLAPIHAGERLLSHAQTAIGHAERSGGSGYLCAACWAGGTPAWHGTPNWRIHPAIAPKDGDRVIDKRTLDGFYETSLFAELAAEGINRLSVMGAQTEVCVDTTCRRAFSLGFEVTLVSDGHSTWENATLTADQIIRHTNDTLAGWFVRLARVDEPGKWVDSFAANAAPSV